MHNCLVNFLCWQPWSWWCRLSSIEEIARAAMKKLTQGMAEHNKAISAAKTEEAKAKIVSFLDTTHSNCLGWAFRLWWLIWYNHKTSAENGAAENYKWIADLQQYIGNDAGSVNVYLTSSHRGAAFASIRLIPLLLISAIACESPFIYWR